MDVNTVSKIATSSLFIHVCFYFEDAGEAKSRHNCKGRVRHVHCMDCMRCGHTVCVMSACQYSTHYFFDLVT